MQKRGGREGERLRKSSWRERENEGEEGRGRLERGIVRSRRKVEKKEGLMRNSRGNFARKERLTKSSRRKVVGKKRMRGRGR